MSVVISEMTTAIAPIGNDTDDIIVEGDNFERDFEYTERDTGDAIDFTGYTGASQIRDDNGTLIGTLTVGTLDETGIVTLSIATLPAAGTYVYDVEIVAGSVKKTIQRGSFRISAQSTQ